MSLQKSKRVLMRKPAVRALYCLGFLSLSLCVVFLEPVSAQETGVQPASVQLASLIENTDTHQVTVQDLNQYCETVYQTELACPSEICFAYFDDMGEDQGFVMRCKAKSCLNLPAKNCPVDTCRIMDGCDNEPVCFPPAKRPPPECGGLAYDGQDVECCEGYVKRCGVEYFDGSCDMSAKHSIYGVPACIPCGNGICNQFENRCNCPEDCN